MTNLTRSEPAVVFVFCLHFGLGSFWTKQKIALLCFEKKRTWTALLCFDTKKYDLDSWTANSKKK